MIRALNRLKNFRYCRSTAFNAVVANRIQSFCTLPSESETDMHLDDEFTFPVFTTIDGEHNFLWSGASISHEVCSLHSEEFDTNKKSVLVRSNNVAVLQTEHSQLGAITFTAIKTNFVKKFKFCSVAVFGDIVTFDASYLYDCQLCINNLIGTLNAIVQRGKPVTETSELGAYFASTYLVGNIPSGSGHLKCLGFKHTLVDNDVENGLGSSSSVTKNPLLAIYQHGNDVYSQALVKQINPLLTSSETVMVKIEVQLTGDNLLPRSSHILVLLIKSEVVNTNDIPEYKWLIGNIIHLD